MLSVLPRRHDSPRAGGVCAVAVDYDFCKGCGICSKMCRFGAISMVDEAAASGDGQAVEERKDDAR